MIHVKLVCKVEEYRVTHAKVAVPIVNLESAVGEILS